MKRICLAVAGLFALQVAGMENPYGMCAHLSRHEPPPRTCAMMANAGLGWVRSDFDLKHVTPRKGEFDFSRYDKILAEVEAAGMKMLPIFLEPPPRLRPVYEHLEEWSNLVHRCVARYGMRLPVIEIWNEPNLDWNTGFMGQNPTNYFKVLKVSYQAAKAACPQVKVAFAGMAGVPVDYFEAVYKLGGKDYCDILNIHPYTSPHAPDVFIESSVNRLRRMLRTYGDERKPIWVTEIGWPTLLPLMPESTIRVIREGLKVARPGQKTFKAVYVPGDKFDDDERWIAEFRRALPEGSTLVTCYGTELGDFLKTNETDAVVFPISQKYNVNCIPVVDEFVTKGGILIDVNGIPALIGCQRTPKGGVYQDNKYVTTGDRELLRISAKNKTTDKRYPGRAAVRGTNGLSGIVFEFADNKYYRDLTGASSWFFTDEFLMPGDALIPLIVAEPISPGVTPIAAGVYMFNSDKKGAIIVDARHCRCYENVSEDRQAALFARAYAVLCAIGIEKMFWYEFRLGEGNPYDRQPWWGVVHANFAPKPAYSACLTFTDMRPAGSVQLAKPWYNKKRTFYYPQWKTPRNEVAGLVWIPEGEESSDLSFTGDKMTFFDKLGRRIWFPQTGDKTWRLKLSPSPIYFIGGEILPDNGK